MSNSPHDTSHTATGELRPLEWREVDQPLREDVNRVGTLVGEILADQLGEGFLAEVERIRVAAIARREQAASITALEAELGGQELDHAVALVRAFATYFQAVNIAERVHRTRRRRDYELAGAAAQPGSLRAVLQELSDEGVPADQLARCLADLHIEPVMTAHPTEAVRRALLEKEYVLVRCLTGAARGPRTPSEWRVDQERMRVALTSGWQTADAPPERPSVADELEHVAFYLTGTLYRTVPLYYQSLAAALTAVGVETSIPAVLRFSTWVGGDMDGNPNVGADTIAATLASQRTQILALYRRDLRRLFTVLSQSRSRVDCSAAVLQRIADYQQRLPDTADRIRPRHRNMPYRMLLVLMEARLIETADGGAQGYAEAAEFRDDLQLIVSSLLDNHGSHAGAQTVQLLIRRVLTFGFHLATLDLRQDSGVHDEALAQLLGDSGFADRSAAQRSEQLHALIQSPGQAAAANGVAVEVLDVLRCVAALRPRYSERAFGPYIISMARSGADALAVLALARVAGCVEDDAVPLDVAPLFETVADLEAAADVMRTLFDDPLYRAHLARRGNRQWVMLGYSDSAKDSGLLASRWALQQTQIDLMQLGKAAGVRISFFHGRGGSASRGGGKAERAVMAGPRGSVDGVLRLTEQGEVIHRKYAITELALRNLEQMTGAVLRATLRPRPADSRETTWRTMVQGMAAVSARTYRELVHEDEDFAEYFRAVTPVDVIERLLIGSRPARRGGTGGVSSLRAIPWVFAWSQNRAGLTAWYGVGTGLAWGIEQFGHAAMAQMLNDWPFFAALVDDVEMVMAKSDLDIFARYSRLAGDQHEVFYPRIADEFARTRDAILALRGENTLLSGDPRLRQSIRLRNPYVDPISVLQVDLLERWRASGCSDDDLLHALIATVNGIAAGIQNTG